MNTHQMIKISNYFVMLGPFIFMTELNKVSADIFHHLLYRRRHSVIEHFFFVSIKI